jgi:uracil-DNA glycosylase
LPRLLDAFTPCNDQNFPPISSTQFMTTLENAVSEPSAPGPTVEHAWLALGVLREHLKVRLANGQDAVWLGEQARGVLNRFHKAKVAVKSEAVVERVAAMKQAAEEAKPMEGDLTMKDELLRLTSGGESAENQISIPQMPDLTLEQKNARLTALRAKAEVSPQARALQTLRDKMVFATGSSQAKLVFVGEAPGAQEEAEGEPFVGPAGQLLTKMIVAMGLKREDVYISNICKFRPSIPGQGTQNRKPTAEEMRSCLPYVQEEMEIIKPSVIVALGATAAEGLLGLSSVAVSRLRVQEHTWRGVPVVVTFHPSYLLRNGALSEKRKAWEDLLKVMKLLAMPISEKQQGFFLPKAD